MSAVAVYLYGIGGVLALSYGHELEGRFTFGAFALIVFWPLVVPVIWTVGIIKTIKAVRK